jgi:hypothetical protein
VLTTPDTVLQLGQYTFSELEVPAQISTGGSQRIVVHELVGGTRTVDSMGQSPRALEWSGWLLGPTALDNSRYIDGLRTAGTALSLRWSEYNYQVVIRDFKPDYRRKYEIPYTIVCEVVSDNTSPVSTPTATPIDAALNYDLNWADALSASINDVALTNIMGSLITVVGLVSTFANASQGTINTVSGPLQQATNRIGVLITAANAIAAGSQGFGGVVAGSDPVYSVAQLTSQLSNMQQLNNLYMMRNVCGRMQSNLGAINGSQVSVATAGGNLFQIAMQQYNDATAWTGIARANGLTNPFITGTDILSIPPQADGQNGVLNF